MSHMKARNAVARRPVWNELFVPTSAARFVVSDIANFGVRQPMTFTRHVFQPFGTALAVPPFVRAWSNACGDRIACDAVTSRPVRGPGSQRTVRSGPSPPLSPDHS